MRDSIDYAIANAKDYNEFIRILEDLDYTVTDKNNKLSIRRDPYKRNTRIERQFGNNYSRENIYKRILETQPEFPYSPNPYLLIDRTYKNYNYIREKHYQNKGSIHKINTEEQLNEFEKEAYKKLAPLKSERENLWKKHKKARTDDDRKLIEKQIAEISKRITPLAEEIRHCKNVQQRMEEIKKFELHQKLEEERKKIIQQEKKKIKFKER